jgi:lysophospholipid acyltransferase (LPLAT)-like uncharacterized protein
VSTKNRSAAKVKLLAFIGFLFARVIYATARNRVHIVNTLPEEPFIYAGWHNSLLMQPWLFRLLGTRSALYAVISESKDGDLISAMGAFAGVHSYRGSTSRGGARVLLNAIKALRRGECIFITPDGPRGPLYSVSEGILTMARKAGVKIVVGTMVPDRAWRAERSWDRFIIPKPFCRMDIYFEAVDIADLDDDDALALIKARMTAFAI